MTRGKSDSDMVTPGEPADWEALARYVAGESTAAEVERVERRLSADPADRDVLEGLRRTFESLQREVRGGVDVEAALASVRSRRGRTARIIPLRPEGRRMGWRMALPAIAAAGLLAIGIGSWNRLRDRQSEQVAISHPRMLATGVGVRDSLTLSDGTRVILGPLSSVSMRAGYGTAGREVDVRGDAWFDVVHDESKPFTVWAGGATVIDIGTKFAVTSDSALGVSVSVTEGSVSMRPSSTLAASGVILHAGDNGVLENRDEVVARRGAVSDDDLAWMRGRLVFRNAPVSQVTASMKRWYGIELKVDPSLMNRHITATFEGESASGALEVIGLVLGADVEIGGDSATLAPAAGRTR